jgi:hypothetical protein
MLVTDFAEAHRLLCACNLAYGVTSSGENPDSLAVVRPVLPSMDVIEAMQAAVAFESGSFYAHETSDRNGIDAFLYGETNDAAVLAFRGTLPARLTADLDRVEQIAADWFNNTRAALVDGRPQGLTGHVHRGYARSLNSLWTSAGGLESLLPRLRAATASGKRLLLTGHSKGGALAQLAALRLAATGEPGLRPAVVATFAAPRAGNHQFASAFDQTFANLAWRFEFQDDFVPHLPPAEGLSFAFRAALHEVVADLTSGRDAVSWTTLAPSFDALTRIGTYESAGRLQFIDWNGELRDQDSMPLRAERLERLRRALAFSPGEVTRAHLPMRGFGYMGFLENRLGTS